MTVATLKSIRNDESYDGFWKSVTLKATHLAVGEPKLPRRRKIPKRYDSGSHSGDYHQRVGQSVRIPGLLLKEMLSFIFLKILSLLGEYLISLEMSWVSSRASFITLDFFKVSQAAKFKEWP